MKKPLAIRIDADVLAAARECARRDNRTLTNFIETVLRQRVASVAAAATASVGHGRSEGDLARGA